MKKRLAAPRRLRAAKPKRPRLSTQKRPPAAPHRAPARRRPRHEPRVSVFIGTSVDGFIARANGDLDFLEVRGDPKGEDYGYYAFVGQIDAIVMGRKTFEKVLSFKAWPYAKTPVVVLTTRPLPIHPKLRGKVETMADRPAEIVKRLRRRGLQRLYLDGGRTVQGFLRAGVVDEITITRVPVLLGQGIPLFGALTEDVRLKHLETRMFRSGMVQTTYAVRRAGKQGAKAGQATVEDQFGPRVAPPARAPPAPAAPVRELQDPPAVRGDDDE